MKTTTLAACAIIVTLTACGGGGSKTSTPSVSKTTQVQSHGQFTSEPVQLTVDPCTLVTKAEAEALIGPVSDTPGVGSDKLTCVYVSSKNTGGQVAVNLQTPEFCKLLFLALDKNYFGGQQVRVDSIGEGGMQVKGNGNVQFVVNRGCVEIEGNVDRDTKIDDSTIMSVATTAAGRVS